MGTLTTENKQLIYIYSQDSPLGIKILSHLRGLDRPIRKVNLNKETLSTSIWLEISAMLGVSFPQLFRRNNSPLFKRQFEIGLTVSDWLKLIEHNPSLLFKPIAINGTIAKIIEAKYDVFDFYDAVDSNVIAASPPIIQFDNFKNSTYHKNAM